MSRTRTYNAGTRISRGWGVIGMAIALVVSHTAATAQSTATSRGAPERLHEAAARLLTREAVIDNRRVREPTLEDFEITSLLIETAQDIDPGEVAIARAGVEARLAAEDQRGAIAHTRRVVQMDPGDTVAQLRLISDIINQKQTAAERLELVDRFLQRGAESIAAEVRSRLALDAALWSRDAGDIDEFVRYLSEATRLDPTNKDAAYVAATYYASQSDDPVGRLDLLANLLYADPLDPNTQLTIARLLSGEGAFVQAKRFHDNAVTIFAQSGIEIRNQIDLERLVLVWLVDGPQRAVDALNRRVVEERDRIVRENRAAEAVGQPIPEGRSAGTRDLAILLERLRLVSASAAGDTATANAASVAIERTIERASESLRIAGTPAEEIEANRQTFLADLHLLRLWAGINEEESLAQARRFLETSADQVNESTIALLNGFIALRSGDTESALQALESIESDAAIRDVGVALAQTANGDVEGARRTLGELASREPLSPTGAWALTVLGREGRASPLADRARAVESLARAIPPWLDRIIVDPDSFMRLTIEPQRTTDSALSRNALRVRMVNTSPMPLAVGPNSALNSKMLLIPRVDVNVERFPGVFGPQVVPIDRRLRLAPREELVVDLWPSFWPQSFYADAFAARTIRTRWRLIQGFVVDQDRGYQPGPLCLAADSPIMTQTPLPEASLSPSELVRRLREDPEETLLADLAAIRALWESGSPTMTSMSAEQKRQIATAAAERYPSLGENARIAMLLRLGGSNVWPEMAPLDEVALQEKDPDVLPVVLFTRTREANHPTFEWASRTGDEKLERLATLLKRRLERGGYAYSRIGMDRGG